MMAEVDREMGRISLSSSKSRDKGRTKEEEERNEVQITRMEDKNPKLISSRWFKEEVYLVKFGEESLTTTLTNFSSALEKWVLDNWEAPTIGLEIKTAKCEKCYEIDLIQICAGKNCILFQTAASDGNSPRHLKAMLKEKHVATARDLLGECNKIFRGKSSLSTLFSEVNLLNMKEHAKKLIKDNRVWNNEHEMLERIVKNEYKTRGSMASKRWNVWLSEDEVVCASYEAHRAYKLGSKLLGGRG